MKTWNFPQRRRQRHEEAVERAEEWNELTTEEKIARLELRGYGDSKEAETLRTRLK